MKVPPPTEGAGRLISAERYSNYDPPGAPVRPKRPNDEAPVAITKPIWRDPDPLPNGLLPVAPFDMDFLPKSISPWVADIADLIQCPPDFVGIPAMIALASAIGRKIAIRPQRNTDWTEVANLWGFIVGPPGSMKSPAMAEAMRPLRRLEANARKNNETALKAYQAVAEDFKSRSEAAKSAFKAALKKDPNAASSAPLEEPVEPKARRYIVDDATYEALGVILVDNPQGVLAYRDELARIMHGGLADVA